MSHSVNDTYIEETFDELESMIEDALDIIGNAIKIAKESELDCIYDDFKYKYPELISLYEAKIRTQK